MQQVTSSIRHQDDRCPPYGSLSRDLHPYAPNRITSIPLLRRSC